MARPKRFELLTPRFVARPGLNWNSLPISSLAFKPLICRADFAASAGTRPHSTATAARRGREGVRHTRDQFLERRHRLPVRHDVYARQLAARTAAPSMSRPRPRRYRWISDCGLRSRFTSATAAASSGYRFYGRWRQSNVRLLSSEFSRWHGGAEGRDTRRCGATDSGELPANAAGRGRSTLRCRPTLRRAATSVPAFSSRRAGAIPIFPVWALGARSEHRLLKMRQAT